MRLFLFITLLFSFGYHLTAQAVSFRKFGTQQGLSHNTVFAITQDERGFMWIGTREGLNRYDSYELKTYYANAQASNLASNRINALLATRDELFVGTSSGLSRYLKEKDAFTRISSQTINEVIHQIYEARDSTVFVCTGKGLYRLDERFQAQALMQDVIVHSICNYKSNVFWLALNDRILLINHLGEIIKSYHPRHPALYPTREDRNHVMHRLLQDSEGQIWLITNKGMFRYDQAADRFVFIALHHQENSIEANVIRAIDEDKDQRLWLGTELGLFIYDKKSGEIQHYNQSFTNTHSLSDKSIYALYISRENISWIGTYFGGLNYAKPPSSGFYKMMPSENGRSISGKAVSQITQSSDGKLWIGTEDGGVSIYDKEKESFEYLKTEASPGLSCNNVHAIHDDQEGNIWIGTFLGGLNRYQPANGQVKIYKNKANDPHSLSNDYVYAIQKDSRGQLWIGTQNGLNIYDYQQDRFELFRPEVMAQKFVYDILEDRNGDLWFCTRWSGIYRYRVATDSLLHYHKSRQEEHGLSCNQIISAFEDRNGGIWFGSLTGGLIHWDPAQQQFSAVTQQDGLPNSNVYGVLEDQQGKLWLTTNKGLSRYEPQNGTVTNFTTAQGLSENQFNFKSSFTDSAGWFYFGTVNGLNYFHPDSSSWDTPASRLYFTNFKLFNKDISSTDQGPLTKHIDLTDTLTLRYRDNVITFEFVAVNYFSEGNNEYAYYLEGFEEDWNEVGNKRTATYTNLSPGDYIFHLRANGPAGAADAPSRRIHLNILPPFWQTNWAILIYCLLAAGGIFSYARFVRFLHRQKLAVQLERVEKEKIREINQHKLNFFTFISHEFKTPLTLIIAAIEKFFQSNKGQAPPEDLLSIKRNANRLHHLIHQLMEFRKIETNHASLDLRKGDIILFLRDTFRAFSPLFKHHNIDYDFKSSHLEYNCYFDPDKLEMIASNLVSNAVKNTPVGGVIKMEINVKRSSDASRLLQLKISDSGSGINETETDQVFSPFYQADGEKKSESRGSGIGLALVRSLIDFMDGQLVMNSRVDQGTTVLVELPVQHKPGAETSGQKAISGNRNFNLHPGLFPEPIPDELRSEVVIPKDQTLLIVEDNRELLKFLNKHFSQQYRVQLAKNGLEALEKIERTIPDLILSDAKMPGMDGVTLCEKLKSNPQTSHIPFLLLTAKTSEQNRINGLKVGANAYLTKPFNLKELDLLIYNTLRAGKQLQQRFSHLEKIESPAIPPNNQDREFLHQVNSLVENHFNDPNFTISRLAQMLGISRSLLHLKMKKILKMSASEFIKNFRMEKACILLRKGHSISEVAYKVGFNDPNYFSKVFKKEFQMLPSIYAEKEVPN